MRVRLKEIMQRKQLADSIKSDIDHLNLISLESPEVKEKSRELDAVVSDLMARIAELEDLGLILRDLDTGLIDFPAMRFGEKVFICWKYGESEVEYWHGSNEGFSGRRHLNIHVVSP